MGAAAMAFIMTGPAKREEREREERPMHCGGLPGYRVLLVRICPAGVNMHSFFMRGLSSAYGMLMP
eukprot:scaffold607078_cov41-Prasinocladus_malaysianus.AAC.1